MGQERRRKQQRNRKRRGRRHTGMLPMSRVRPWLDLLGHPTTPLPPMNQAGNNVMVSTSTPFSGYWGAASLSRMTPQHFTPLALFPPPGYPSTGYSGPNSSRSGCSRCTSRISSGETERSWNGLVVAAWLVVDQRYVTTPIRLDSLGRRDNAISVVHSG